MVNLTFLSNIQLLVWKIPYCTLYMYKQINQGRPRQLFPAQFLFKTSPFWKMREIFGDIRFNVSTSERKSMKYSTRHRFWNLPAVNSHVLCFKQRAIIEILPTESSSVRESHKRLKASEDVTLRAETQQVAVWIERRRQTNVTRQAMYLQHNIEGCSYNNWCSGKAISFTYFECVFLVFGNQRVMCMSHVVICGLSGCTVIFHITSYTALVPKEKKYIYIYTSEHKMCVLISYTNVAWKISYYWKNWASYDQICILVFMQSTRYYWQI
jgi:hypothetical protein